MRKNHIFLLLLALSLSAFMTSCRTYTEQTGVTYLKNSEQDLYQTLQTPYSVRIKPDDELQITISSTVPQATSQYNLPPVNFFGRGDSQLSSTNAISTFIVSESGEIEIPNLGKVKAAGMTTEELSKMLAEKIGETVKDPIVKVELSNFHVVVLGAVGSAGTKRFTGQRCSIFEAIGAAGDITLHGRKDNVVLMRENNGTVEKHTLDLTDQAILKSPYYYLQQNDVLIVDATDVHKENSTYNSMNSFRLQTTSTIVSAASVIASLIIAILVK